MSRRVESRKELGERRSARLRWAGWRHSWRPDVFREFSRAMWLRRVNEGDGHRRKKNDAQDDGLGLGENLNRVLRRRMRLVMAVVAVLVSIVVVVEMGGRYLGRQRIVAVPLA